jgi:hypothetical protein
MKVGRCVEVKSPIGPSAKNIDGLHPLDGRRCLAFRRAEGAEIMFSDQHLRSLAHQLGVQRAKHPTHQARLQRRSGNRLSDEVRIAPTLCAESRVKVELRRMAPLNTDVCGEEPVGAAHPRKQFSMHRSINVNHLIQRMHTRVGAAGADSANGIVRKSGQRPLDVVLHRSAIGLALPAVVCLSTVADAQRQPHGWQAHETNSVLRAAPFASDPRPDTEGLRGLCVACDW